jgi:hypothetical protein
MCAAIVIASLAWIYLTALNCARAQESLFSLKSNLKIFGDMDFGLNTHENYMHINFTVEGDYQRMKAFSVAPLPQLTL